MKKPEEVLGEEKHPKKKKSMGKKHHYRETRIEHHHDGSHTMRHMPHDGGEEKSYAVPDLEGAKQGLDENVGQPEQAEGGAPEGAAGGMPPGGGGGGGAAPPASPMMA